MGNKLTDTIYWMGSASSSGVGQAITGQTNHPDALFFNPAALNTNKKSSLNINYSEIYQTNISNFSFIASSPGLSFGVGIHSTQSPDIENTKWHSGNGQIIQLGHYQYSYSALFVSTALKLPFISFGHFGTSLHFHRMSMDSQTLQGQSINASVLFTPLSFVSIGYTHHNLIPLKLQWKTSQIIHEEIIQNEHLVESYGTIGLELLVLNKSKLKWAILADVDIDDIETNPVNNYSPLKVGTQFSIYPLRVSFGHNHRYMAIGVSTILKQIQLNYTFNLPNISEGFSNRHAFGLNYTF